MGVVMHVSMDRILQLPFTCILYHLMWVLAVGKEKDLHYLNKWKITLNNNLIHILEVDFILNDVNFKKSFGEYAIQYNKRTTFKITWLILQFIMEYERKYKWTHI